MKVHFGQVYIEPGVALPFSHHFQRRLSEEITALVTSSTKFTQRYGEDWELMFRISAKRTICDNEIRGPSVFKNDKDVEFTIFLPFDAIQREASVSRSAIGFLLCGVCAVLDSLGFDTSEIQARLSSLAESISSDPTMFEPDDCDA
ncbi:MAG TPA: hypothetical protein DCE44_02705 [Verrucomicrobiales bacterium]|nr:hypothetical protein [Verrucomicrobiales bacterium]